MTPDERNLLNRFLSDLTQVRGVQKDPDAAALISRTINASPDAPYLLVQHAMLADQALGAAQARIAELEQHIRSLPQPQAAQGAPAHGGLLGGLFGGGQRAQPQPAYQAQYQPQPGPWGGPQPQAVTPQLQPQQGGLFGGGAPAQPGGMGGFLRNAGTTAAGVAGGAFLFEGISNLFGGGHGGGGFLGGGYGGQPENVTINEYGDQGGAGGGWDQGGGGSDGGFQDDSGGGGGDFS